MILLNHQAAVGMELPAVGVGHFPQVAVRVGEVAGVAAPEGVGGRFFELAAGVHSLLQEAVDVFLLAGIVRQGDAGKTAALGAVTSLSMV